MRHIGIRPFTLGLLLTAALGCGFGDGHAKFIPKPATARGALETVLTSWKSGQRPMQIALDSTPIEVIDSKWRAGHRLGDFEIVTEEPGDGPRWFAVKLTMQKPAGAQLVRYVVVGNSPLWVYREEDYKKASGTSSGM
jgi:hypothetical protein